jgi:DNA-binding transcriptional ArsR family regulator
VQELVDELGTTQQNISQHLGILRRAGIVSREKEGTRVRYQVADAGIVPILERTEASLALAGWPARSCAGRLMRGTAIRLVRCR